MNENRCLKKFFLFLRWNRFKVDFDWRTDFSMVFFQCRKRWSRYSSTVHDPKSIDHRKWTTVSSLCCKSIRNPKSKWKRVSRILSWRKIRFFFVFFGCANRVARPSFLWNWSIDALQEIKYILASLYQSLMHRANSFRSQKSISFPSREWKSNGTMKTIRERKIPTIDKKFTLNSSHSVRMTTAWESFAASYGSLAILTNFLTAEKTKFFNEKRFLDFLYVRSRFDLFVQLNREKFAPMKLSDRKFARKHLQQAKTDKRECSKIR